MANENEIEFTVRIKDDGLGQVAQNIDRVEDAASGLASTAGSAGAGLDKLGDAAGAAGTDLGKLANAQGQVESTGAELGSSANAAGGSVAGMGKSAVQAGDELGRLASATAQKNEAIRSGLALEKSEIDLQRQQLQLDKEQQQAILQVAKAKGDEATATQAENRLREIEIEQLGLAARGKRAEASAIDEAAEARREQLSAVGPLTAAQRNELETSENLAKNLRVQATAADEAAQRAGTLGKAAAQAGNDLAQLSAATEEKNKAIRSGLAVEQSAIELQRQMLVMARDEQQAALQKAKASGDEAAATQAQIRLAQIEAEQLALTSRAKRSEGLAIQQVAEARREQLSAMGPLTLAQKQELTVLENQAAALRVQAATADTAANRSRSYADSISQGAKASAQLAQDSKAARAGIDGVGSSAQSTSDFLRLMGPLLASAFSAQQIVQILATQESLDRSYGQIFGTLAKGRAEMDFVRATANKLGIENQVLANSYQSLAASTKGTAIEGQATRDVFEAVARAMSTLGKSSAETDRALTAVSQIASKGTASMEELRGQLGEALPGAMKAAADGAGITVEELVEMVSSGSVLASDILPALTKGLNDLYGKAEPPKGMVAEWARIKNILTDTVTAMGEGGGTELLTKGLVTAARAAVGFKDAFISTGVAVGETVAKITTGNTELGTLEERLLAAADRQNALAGASQGAAQAQAGLTAAQQAGGDAAQESFRKQELLAQKLEQTGASMLAVKAQYATLSTGASDYTKQLEKNIAARTAEMTALTQLVGVYGSEVEKRQAASQAAELQATAAKELATAREAEAVIAQSLALRLQDEARKRGDNTDATKKEIEAAQKSAQAKRAEADQAAASATSKVTEAEATKASTLAYQDNSARVYELRGAMQSAAAEVERLVRLQREGKATDEEVATARSKLSAATLLYRDALRDASEAAERKITAERQSAQVAQTTTSVNLERVKALQAVAEAQGNETRATQLAQQATMLQVRAAQEAAAAARAEAEAIRESADAKERELRASGELTTAKQAEIEAQRKSAELKDLEAKRADILAYKTRELGNIQNSRTDQAVTGYAREENALRQIAQASRDAEAAERSRAEAAAEAERKRLNMDKEGFTTDSSGNRIAMGGDLSTLTGIAAFLQAAGVDDEAEARRIAKEFANEKGEIQYLNNAGQIKYGGRSSTLSQAVLKAAEKYTFSDKNMKASSIPSQTQTININIDGKKTAVTVATASDAEALRRVLEQLTDAAGRS